MMIVWGHHININMVVYSKIRAHHCKTSLPRTLAAEKGGFGASGGYRSYDHGAVIREDRTVFQLKNSEAKLLASFFKHPRPTGLLDSVKAQIGALWTLARTPLNGPNMTNFNIVRHAAYNGLDSTHHP